MTLLQAMLFALLHSAAAGPKDRELELFGNHTIPGWLPNIFNPLVWAAFPDAHKYYNDIYLSNVTFDGPGQNYSHPVYPNYLIPTVTPPRPRVVPPYNPAVTGGSDQQNEDPNITPDENSTESSASGAQHPKMLPLNLDKKLQLLRNRLPRFDLQAVSGTLGSGQTLQQGVPLNSSDNMVFLIAQSDGNLVLYNSALYRVYGASAQAAIWASNTNAQGSTPVRLVMQTDCNLVLYTAANNAIYNSNTYNPANAPCSLSVLSAVGGYIEIDTAAGAAVFRQPPNTGALRTGQQLPQGVPLYSTDNAVLLLVQSDGNLVLYNSALYAQYGPVSYAAIWASYAFGSPAPFLLQMQGCNAVEFNGNGTAPANAIWSTQTAGEGTPPCALTVTSANGGNVILLDSTGQQYFRAIPAPTSAATTGMWRTPHPSPDIGNSTKGLSGASAVAMAYLTDGTVVFAERPHPLADGITNNPLIVNLTNNVGTLASLYTASYYGQNITGGDTFRPLNCQSQAFCVGLTVDALGNAILVGGDNQCVGCLFRTAAEKAANIPYPNGYYDVRRYVPGAVNMTVPDRMFDLNSVTGLPNTARDCCIQLPTDPNPIPNSCVPDANCSPRWYPTLTTLPSGNILIVGGCLVTSGGYAANLQNPTWQIYGTMNQTLTYNSPFPTTILTDQVPYSLYPLMWVLPETASILILDGTAGQIISTRGDSLVALDSRYTSPPDVQWPLTFGNIAANVMLPLSYPNYTAEFLIIGGSDDSGNGLAYSQRLSNVAPYQTPSWVVENMNGYRRFEGCAVLLPDGTVFLASGAQHGYTGGTWNAGNAQYDFVTAPQIYNPTAPVGQRWSQLLTDSGIDRGYHNSALLIASGEVMVAGSEPTGEYRVQYYVPAYLLKGNPQPVISTVSTTKLTYNKAFTVSYTLRNDTLKSVVMIRTAGSTHSVQMDQRMIVLMTNVTSATSVSALAPPDATIAPPGYYMLFLVSAKGTPSVARFVSLPMGGGLTPALPPAPTPTPTPPPGPNGTLASGQSLQQGVKLNSTDSRVFLIVQSDGNLVLYNSTLYAQYGATAQAAIWASNTSGNGPGAGPYRLTMQTDCNLVLYSSGNAAIFSTATYGQGTPPCSAVVSSSAGGTLSVLDSTGRVLYRAPGTTTG